MSLRVIGAGVVVGAGALLTVGGLAVHVLPIETAFDVAKVFQVPGRNTQSYLTWDGSMLFLGVILLVIGVRRWAVDAKQTPQGVQEGYPYQPVYPRPQQPAPWPGYPGQQGPGQQPPGQQGQQQGQQPGYPPHGQQPGYPPQGQPPGYPQQPGRTFPG